MNIVFFGTSEFAIPAFRKLLDSQNKVLALVTQPDRKKGRDLKVSPPPTKVLALSKGIPVYQPQNASDSDSIKYLTGLGADLFVVIAFGQILKEEILTIPRFFSINVHGSLLPKYRGAAPTNWAIINGDMVSGVTVIKMNEKMDGGDIILKQETGIAPEETNITLSEKLSELGAKAVMQAIEMIGSEKELNFEKQREEGATYAPKLKKADGLIDWSEDAVKINNKIRGFIPWPGAYTHYNEKILKILHADIPDYQSSVAAAEGEVVSVTKDVGIIVRAGTDYLAIKYLQLEGKKILDADSFVRGHKISKGYRFR